MLSLLVLFLSALGWGRGRGWRGTHTHTPELLLLCSYGAAHESGHSWAQWPFPTWPFPSSPPTPGCSAPVWEQAQEGETQSPTQGRTNSGGPSVLWWLKTARTAAAGGGGREKGGKRMWGWARESSESDGEIITWFRDLNNSMVDAPMVCSSLSDGWRKSWEQGWSHPVATICCSCTLLYKILDLPMRS